jgi:hypothetical protein
MSLLPEPIAPPSREILQRLAARAWSSEAYLAGSAALALHLAHRPVRDLDFMLASNRLTPQERRDLLGDLRASDGETTVETARDGYLFARSGSGVGQRFFYYPYPLVEPEESCLGMSVASLVDLGLMKLAAIISRGERRDFVDLYLLTRRVGLDELLLRAEDKFGHVGDFPLQALKSLADLSAMAGEPMPRLSSPLDWEAVEEWLRGEVRELARARLGLSAVPPPPFG